MEEIKAKVPIGINRLIVFANSKRELYKLIKFIKKYYLSPLSHKDSDYIYDILTGFKKVKMTEQYLL